MTTHGHTRKVNGKRSVSREWSTWDHMRRRVRTNPKYAQRGIDAAWSQSFELFYHYVQETIGLHPGDGYTLERVDNDRGYFPGNIRWATMREQSQNRGSYDRNTRHLRRQCECGMISNPGAIGKHIKSTGHSVKYDYV